MRALPGPLGRLLALIASAAGATPAFAHVRAALTPQDLWTAWAWEPGAVLGLAGATWLYGRGLRALWRASAPGRGVSRWQGVAGVAGWLALWLALISPLHALGGALFSAHMVQHELLMLVAAPLLALGRPLIVCLWALPLRWRQALGGSVALGLVRRLWAGAVEARRRLAGACRRALGLACPRTGASVARQPDRACPPAPQPAGLGRALLVGPHPRPRSTDRRWGRRAVRLHDLCACQRPRCPPELRPPRPGIRRTPRAPGRGALHPWRINNSPD
jgi:hypothetical protein